MENNTKVYNTCILNANKYTHDQVIYIYLEYNV